MNRKAGMIQSYGNSLDGGSVLGIQWRPFFYCCFGQQAQGLRSRINAFGDIP